MDGLEELKLEPVSEHGVGRNRNDLEFGLVLVLLPFNIGLCVKVTWEQK